MVNLLFCLHFFKKIFCLALLFLVMAAQNALFIYFEHMASCFPATIITTQKEPVEQALGEIKLCSVSVQSERMTFDSSIFNHYETLPVKEIFLYSVELPYQNWSEIKNMEDTITEANPYIEETVSFYLGSKMKSLLISLVFSIFIGAILIFKITAADKMSKKQFVVLLIINSILYVAASILLLTAFPAFVMPLSAISAGVLFSIFILVSLLNYRLAKW